jgi:hypothetical protein
MRVRILGNMVEGVVQLSRDTRCRVFAIVWSVYIALFLSIVLFFTYYSRAIAKLPVLECGKGLHCEVTFLPAALARRSQPRPHVVQERSRLSLTRYTGPKVTQADTIWSAQSDNVWYQFLIASGASLVFCKGEPETDPETWVANPGSSQAHKGPAPRGRIVRHLTGALPPELEVLRRQVAAVSGVEVSSIHIWALYTPDVIARVENALQPAVSALRGSLQRIQLVRYRWIQSPNGLTPELVDVE